MFTAFNHGSLLKRNFTQAYRTTAAMVSEIELVDLFLDLLFALNKVQIRLQMDNTSKFSIFALPTN